MPPKQLAPQCSVFILESYQIRLLILHTYVKVIPVKSKFAKLLK